MANKATITVKTMEKDKDGKNVEQLLFTKNISGIDEVPEIPEVKASPAKVVPMGADVEVKPAVAAQEKVPESAVIRMSDGSTLHVAHSAKDVAGMLG